jgi:hypothetical protein
MAEKKIVSALIPMPYYNRIWERAKELAGTGKPNMSKALIEVLAKIYGELPNDEPKVETTTA